MRLRLLVAAIVFGIIPVDRLFADEKADARRTPEEALKVGLRLLEAKQYDQFVRSFLPPDQAAEELATPEKAMEFVKNWVMDKAPGVLLKLQVVKESKPIVEADGKTARFEGKDKAGEKVKITFIKVGAAWYLQ